MRNLGCLIVALSVCVVRGEDWTEFRGSKTASGHASVALPTEWSETENVTWKVPVPGIGWSSPVVADGAIYLTTSVGDGDGLKDPQSLRVLRLNAKTGKQEWNVELFQQPGKTVQVHKKNSHASATPIIEGDRVYVHFGASGTACVTTSGEVVWKKTLKYAPLHGNGGSPALHGSNLIICCDGSDTQYVVGMDKKTGDINWKQDRNCEVRRGFSFCTPTVIEANGRVQAICPGSGKVVSYDPDTGKELWHVDYGEGYSVVPRPVFANGLVYVCSGFSDGQLFAIDPGGEGDVTETHVKWKIKGGVPQSPSILVVGKEVYLVSDRGVATCRDAMTGEELWKRRLNGKFSASPSFANGHVYFPDENGTTTVAVAAREYQQVSKNAIAGGKERTFASFGVVDQAILLRSERHLYRIEDKK